MGGEAGSQTSGLSFDGQAEMEEAKKKPLRSGGKKLSCYAGRPCTSYTCRTGSSITLKI